MKKIISALILSLLLCSCVTRQACERRFAGVGFGFGAGTNINTTSSTNTQTVIRDTTIYIHIPGDSAGTSVLLNDVVRLNATLTSDHSTAVSRLKTKLGISSVWLKDGRLHHRLVQKDSTVATTLKGALKTITTHDEKEHTILQTRYINQLTGWQWTQVYLGRVFLGVLAIVVLWYLLKRNLITV